MVSKSIIALALCVDHLQSHKKRKLSGQQDFCRKNFPDKARKSRQFSNSRQMRIKGGFARFCASAWSKYAPQAVLTIDVPNLGHLGSSGNFPDHPSTFLDHPDSFQIIWTHFRDYPDTVQIVWKLSRSFTLFSDYPDTLSTFTGHFQDHPETFKINQTHFQIIQTLFRLSGHIFQINRTLLGSSGNFQDYPDTLLDHPDSFQIIQIHFLDYPDTFQIVRKLSSSSGHFAYYLDILYCKVSGNSSANNELVAKTFRICKNFPVSIADALTGFL